MRVLVTGGSGLIGMALRPMLAARRHAVTACDATDFGRGDRDLLIVPLDDAAALEAIVRERAIESIIHCGAISGPMLAKGQPLTIVDTNIAATARLLDIARRHNLRRFVFCSSIGIYGNVGEGVIGEEIPLKPTSVYGASKVAAEALVRAFVAEYGLSATSLRPSRVYGPYRRASCFIRDMVRDAMAGRTTLIPCDPAFLFHYVYVDDVAGALVAALEADHLPHLAYNVDGGTPMTMPEIAAIARAALPGARIELTPGSDEVADLQAGFDIGRIAADLGWRPHFDLAAGIRAYAANMPDPASLGT
jgi:UDP-glucuronate 4-epimerase